MMFFEKYYWKEVFSPKDIIKTTVQTIIGTILIGSFFMVSSDYIFPTPNLHGHWSFTTYPKLTASQDRKNKVMQLTYSVRLLQEGNKIIGVGEKISAEVPHNNLGVTEFKESYTGSERVHIKIKGYIENNYFADDEIRILYYEGQHDEKVRETVTIQDLKLNDKQGMKGIFDSTIADTKGYVVWERY